MEQKVEIKVNRSNAGAFTDAAGNLKDIYERLVIIHDLAARDEGGARQGFARNLIIQPALERVVAELKTELARILPGVDAIRRQTVAPEKYEHLKAKGFYDDEPYLEGGAV